MENKYEHITYSAYLRICGEETLSQCISAQYICPESISISSEKGGNPVAQQGGTEECGNIGEIIGRV
jgi:hypothetical protein